MEDSRASRRQASSRHIARNRHDDPAYQRASQAAAAIHYEEGEPTNDLPQSWYQKDDLGTDEINAIMAASQDQAAPNSSEDEVPEQYRIMAHVEASMRVKENTGFDMEEYEKRRKLNPEPSKSDFFDGSRKPKVALPSPKTIAGGSSMRAEEPPLPPPRPNRRFLEQSAPLVPDVCDGIVSSGQSVPDGEHIVKCLGCKILLLVNIMATMVNCPECSTVSPATSSGN